MDNFSWDAEISHDSIGDMTWNWNDDKLSKVKTREEMEHDRAAARKHFKVAADIVKLSNTVLANSDGRGQKAKQHFKSAFDAIKLSNLTLAHSDGRGQRAIARLKGAKNAILLAHMNEYVYHPHRKDYIHKSDMADHADIDNAVIAMSDAEVEEHKRHQLLSASELMDKLERHLTEVETDLGIEATDYSDPTILPSASDKSLNDRNANVDSTAGEMEVKTHSIEGKVTGQLLTLTPAEQLDIIQSSDTQHTVNTNIHLWKSDADIVDEAGEAGGKNTIIAEDVIDDTGSLPSVRRDSNSTLSTSRRSANPSVKNEEGESITSMSRQGSIASRKSKSSQGQQQQQQSALFQALSLPSKKKEKSEKKSMLDLLGQEEYISLQQERQRIVNPFVSGKGSSPSVCRDDGSVRSKSSREAVLQSIENEQQIEEGEYIIREQREGGGLFINTDAPSTSYLRDPNSSSSKGRLPSVKLAKTAGAVLKELRSKKRREAEEATTQLQQQQRIQEETAFPSARSIASNASVQDSITQMQSMVKELQFQQLKLQQQQQQQQIERLTALTSPTHNLDAMMATTMPGRHDGSRSYPKPPSNLSSLPQHPPSSHRSITSTNTAHSKDVMDDMSDISEGTELYDGTERESSTGEGISISGSKKRGSKVSRKQAGSEVLETLSQLSIEEGLSTSRTDATDATAIRSLAALQRAKDMTLPLLSQAPEAHGGRPKIILENLEVQMQRYVREVAAIRIQSLIRRYQCSKRVQLLAQLSIIKKEVLASMHTSVIEEVIVSESVKISSTLYAEFNKLDAKETALLYEIEKVYISLEGEVLQDISTKVTMQCVQELVDDYRHKKRADQSTNPLVRVVMEIIEDTLEDKSIFKDKIILQSEEQTMADLLESSQNKAADIANNRGSVDESASALTGLDTAANPLSFSYMSSMEKKRIAMEHSLVRQIIRDSILESAEEHLLNKKIESVYNSIVDEQLATHAYPYIPILYEAERNRRQNERFDLKDAIEGAEPAISRTVSDAALIEKEKVEIEEKEVQTGMRIDGKKLELTQEEVEEVHKARGNWKELFEVWKEYNHKDHNIQDTNGDGKGDDVNSADTTGNPVNQDGTNSKESPLANTLLQSLKASSKTKNACPFYCSLYHYHGHCPHTIDIDKQSSTSKLIDTDPASPFNHPLPSYHPIYNQRDIDIMKSHSFTQISSMKSTGSIQGLAHYHQGGFNPFGVHSTGDLGTKGGNHEVEGELTPLPDKVATPWRAGPGAVMDPTDNHADNRNVIARSNSDGNTKAGGGNRSIVPSVSKPKRTHLRSLYSGNGYTIRYDKGYLLEEPSTNGSTQVIGAISGKGEVVKMKLLCPQLCGEFYFLGQCRHARMINAALANSSAQLSKVSSQAPAPPDISDVLSIGSVLTEALLEELETNLSDSLAAEAVMDEAAIICDEVISTIAQDFEEVRTKKDRLAVEVVARKVIGRHLVMRRGLWHLSEDLDTLMVEHYLKIITRRYVAQRCVQMLDTAHRQIQRIVHPSGSLLRNTLKQRVVPIMIDQVVNSFKVESRGWMDKVDQLEAYSDMLPKDVQQVVDSQSMPRWKEYGKMQTRDNVNWDESSSNGWYSDKALPRVQVDAPTGMTQYYWDELERYRQRMGYPFNGPKDPNAVEEIVEDGRLSPSKSNTSLSGSEIHRSGSNATNMDHQVSQNSDVAANNKQAPEETGKEEEKLQEKESCPISCSLFHFYGKCDHETTNVDNSIGDTQSVAASESGEDKENIKLNSSDSQVSQQSMPLEDKENNKLSRSGSQGSQQSMPLTSSGRRISSKGSIVSNSGDIAQIEEEKEKVNGGGNGENILHEGD
jgi:hypothetical protein